GKARGLGSSTVLELHRTSPLCLLPHRTYYLDIPLEVSLQRQELRGAAKDYFEAEKQDFYLNLLDGYREASELFPERIHRLDATQSIQDVGRGLWEDLERLLP